MSRATFHFTSLHRDLLAFVLILICSLGAMFNVYKINAPPLWDGVIYHRLVEDYVRGGLSFSAINGNAAGNTQISISYLHRPLFMAIAGCLHAWSGLPLIEIYPAMNLLFLTMSAFYLYKICMEHYGIPVIVSTIAACWLLVSPPVLINHQVVASPEPLVLCFTAGSYYYFGLERYGLAYAVLALATLSKPSAVVLAVYFAVQLLYTLKENSHARVLSRIAFLAGSSAFALALPYVLISHGSAAFSPGLVAEIVDGNRGHLFMSLLFNFGILWIPFGASLPFTKSAYRTGLVCLVLASGILATIGATDWFRVWFSILFVFVLPGAANGVKLISKNEHGIMVVVAVALSIIILQSKPLLDLNLVYYPDKGLYMWAAVILLLAAIAVNVRQILKPRVE